jgi:ubiquinone/menaquinone biosynthesis C-methylase UbiE
MRPEQYDAWYDTPRGRWIGEVEWALLRSALELRPGDSVLDVGCGTGHFTRRAAAEGAQIVGLDLDERALEFARRRSPETVQFLPGDTTCLPFDDRSFDKVMSVTALCFVPQWQMAVAEIVRVSRRRFALGLLNRNSLLWLQKGRGGSSGAYRGAHWHTVAEIAPVLQSLRVTDVRYSCGVFLPGGGAVARMTECALPSMLRMGAFMTVAGAVRHP